MEQIPLEAMSWVHERDDDDDWENPAWIYQGQIVPNYPNSLLRLNGWTCGGEERREVNIVYFAFSKAFDTISSAIPAAKLGKYRLDGWLVGRVVSWLAQQVPSVVVNGVKTNQHYPGLDAGTERFSDLHQ